MATLADIRPDQLSDTELLRRILGGEKLLYEFVVRRYNQRLFRMGMSILGNDAETEEAMQSTYVKAYEKLAKFEQRAQLGTWLTRIMLNECLGMQNRKQRFDSGFDSGDVENHLQNKSGMKTPAHVLMNKELGIILENAVGLLPERYRVVFVLREIEEMSVQETGEVLSINESNVKVRLNRAKSMLRKNLEGLYKEQVYAFHLTRCDRIVKAVLARLRIA